MKRRTTDRRPLVEAVVEGVGNVVNREGVGNESVRGLQPERVLEGLGVPRKLAHKWVAEVTSAPR